MKKLLAKVLLVDDFEPFRAFVYSIINKEPGLTIVGDVADGEEAVHAAEQLQPDMIVLDIGLPTVDGLAAAKRIFEKSPKSRIVFCTGNRCLDIAEQAMRNGARGYVIKQDAGKELLAAIEAVLSGRRFLSSTLTRDMAKAEARASHRSRSERFATSRAG